MIRIYNEQIPNHARCTSCRHRIGLEMDTSCWRWVLPDGTQIFTCEECKLEQDRSFDEDDNEEHEHCAGGCSQCLGVP